MRTLPLNEDILQHCNEYFADYDFIQMLFMIVIGMITLMTVVKVVLPDHGTTNLSLYLGLFTLILIVAMLSRDTFVLGYFKFTDETKVQLLFGVKSFLATWMLMCYT
jgi:hypothetical protein